MEPIQGKSEKELKCKFKIQDRETIKQIVQDTLAAYQIMPVSDAKLKPQVDEYFDTPEYLLAHREHSLRVREMKDGGIEGTYKIGGKQGEAILDRPEATIMIQEKNARALIEGAKEQYRIDLPEGIVSAIFVENQRVKQDYSIRGIELELAFDDVTNIDANTGKRKKASCDEFEIEFKSDIEPEKAEEIMGRIWLTVLRKCSEQGIWIQKSKHNKYVSALMDLGIISDKDRVPEEQK